MSLGHAAIRYNRFLSFWALAASSILIEQNMEVSALVKQSHLRMNQGPFKIKTIKTRTPWKKMARNKLFRLMLMRNTNPVCEPNDMLLHIHNFSSNAPYSYNFFSIQAIVHWIRTLNQQLRLLPTVCTCLFKCYPI